jgi:predicted nucleic acid-binding protein
LSYVVDASVAIKWLLQEVYSDAARRLLSSGETLAAPDLLYAEVGNVLWKRCGRGELTLEEATATAAAFALVPLAIYPVQPLFLAAIELAVRTGRTVYDSVYVALAEQTGYPLVTADQRLYNSLQGGPLASRLMWVEDLP